MRRDFLNVVLNFRELVCVAFIGRNADRNCCACFRQPCAVLELP